MRDYDYRIQDFVDYSIPLLLPGWLKREAESNPRLAKALQESIDPITPLNQNTTYRDGFSNPYRTGYDLPIVPTTEDPLREWDTVTRERILSNCHAAYARNPVANAAVEFTTDFVVGDGFNLICKNKEVEEILKAFIANPDNAIRDWERQAVSDLQIDGELVLRYFTKKSESGESNGKSSDMVVVPQRPWELMWIKTEAGFFRRFETFHFQRYLQKGDDPSAGTETEIEDVSADDVQFIAINRHGYELRGRPDLYKMLPWLRADKDFLEDRVRQNKWRGALLWHVKVENATASTIANVAARWRKPPSPGSAYVSSAFEEVNPLSNPTQADDASLDGRAIRLMILIGARLPEYFFADGENANLASSTNQQLPALTKFEAYQQIMVERVWIPMFKRVLQAAIDAGELPEEVEECDTMGNPVMEDATDEEYEADKEAQKTSATEGRMLKKAYTDSLGITHFIYEEALTPPSKTPMQPSQPAAQESLYESDMIARGYKKSQVNGFVYWEEAYPVISDKIAKPTPMQPSQPAPTISGVVDDMLTGKQAEVPDEPPQKAKTISTLDAFEVSYEPVTRQDLAALTNMLNTVVTNGWVSQQTAVEKLGFDPSLESDRKKREAKQDIQDMRASIKAPNPEVQNMLGMKADMMGGGNGNER